MKKTFTILLAALAIAACDSKKQTPANNSADSTKTDTIAAALPSSPYASADLALYGVKGQVLSFQEEIFEGEADGTYDKESGFGALTTTFDKDGNLVSDESLYINKNWEVTRDEQGRITDIDGDYDGECPYEYLNCYSYDENGRLAARDEEYIGELHGTNRWVYTYDKDGNITGWEAIKYGDGITIEEQVTIIPMDVDEQGNWTRATFQSHYKEYDENDGEKKLTTEDDTYNVHIRSFKYSY